MTNFIIYLNLTLKEEEYLTERFYKVTTSYFFTTNTNISEIF